MKIKRKVSNNLGRTQGFQADRLYGQIKKKFGATRKCPFYGGRKYSQFNNNTHNILNPKFPNPNVPIEQFDFCLKNGNWNLQTYCKQCYKAYRDARIGSARSTWVKKDGSLMNDSEIRKWYRDNVGPKMVCSVCKKELGPDSFSVSRSMEKGLHNMCEDCAVARANSVREREWLSDGDWDSWTKAVLKMKKEKRVKCVGWPRSVAAGFCLKYESGKKIHADHIIPLRAGGIHDAKNLQPLCTACNIKKTDQIDPRISAAGIRKLVSNRYIKFISDSDSVQTIERKLKTALKEFIKSLVRNGEYLDAIRAKKKEVNGQWDVNRVYKKGIEWLQGEKINRTTL